MNFYTIGLPRSKSLWLTHLLNTDEADCFHEGLTEGIDFPQSSKKYVGSCDTNPFIDTPRQPLVIIERSPGAVIDSIIRNFDNPFETGPFTPFVLGFVSKLSDALEKLDGKRYAFDDLNDMDCLIELVTYLKPDEEITAKKKYDMLYLIHTNIQITVRNLKPGMQLLAKQFNTDLDGLYNLMAR